MAATLVCTVSLLVAFLFYRRAQKLTASTEATGSYERPPETSDEVEKKRRDYSASEKAFQEMMNYNVYQAYGMEPKEMK